MPSRRTDVIVALVVFGVCLGAYLATLAPGLPHPAGDSHEFTMSAARLRLARRTGYPLYTWLGFLFVHLVPYGEVAYRTNLMSAVLGAGGVSLLYLIGRRLDLGPVAAALAALLFGSSTVFWSQAVITEVYAPNVFMLALTLWLVLAWAARAADRPEGRAATALLAGFALAFGLSLGTHLSNLLLAPVFASFVIWADPGVLRRRRTLLLVLGLFLLGAAQYAWVPLRAETARFPNPRPDTLDAVWAYTLGAFPGLRFAFPLSALPRTVGVYLACLVETFTPLGVVFGLVGMWALLAHDVARFWLVLGLYAVTVGPATQLAVPDLEVFFISGHFVWALFVGWGIQTAWDGFGAMGGRWQLVRRTAVILLSSGLVLSVARASVLATDRHTDTTFGDFFRNVFDVLPARATLVVQPGVFGEGARYWQEIYGLRPDVTMVGALGSPRPSLDPPPFTVVPEESGWSRLPKGAWYVPVLLGDRQDLVLRRVQTRAPALMAAAVGQTARLDRSVGDVTLAGVALAPTAGPRVHVKAYWHLDGATLPFISSRVDETTLETHELGLGLAARYGREVGSVRDGFLVEEFDLVLPSTLSPGEHVLRLGVTAFTPAMKVEWIDVGRITID